MLKRIEKSEYFQTYFVSFVCMDLGIKMTVKESKSVGETNLQAKSKLKY